MVLLDFGAYTLSPSLLLYDAQSLPNEHQALGGATIDAVRQVGRAIILAIWVAVDVVTQKDHDPSATQTATEYSNLHNFCFSQRVWAGVWFNVVLACVGVLVVAFGFRVRRNEVAF